MRRETEKESCDCVDVRHEEECKVGSREREREGTVESDPEKGSRERGRARDE